jgi:outer membrane protein TolC
MRRTILTTLALVALATGAGAQTPPTEAAAPRTLQLTLDDAVKMALEHNIDLNVDRLDPQISDTRVAAAAGAFRPSFNAGAQRNNQLQPPSSFLIPTATRYDVVTSNAG